jgi:hypothetical protein
MKTRSVKLILIVGFLLSAGLYVSCSSDDPAPAAADKTALIEEMAIANTVVLTTTEGVEVGQYELGSKVPYVTAIINAQVVAYDAKAKQDEVSGAVANLQAAGDVYESHLIAPIDPASLVGHWTFDNLANTDLNAVVSDYSGNNRHGALKAGHATFGSGTAAFAADRYGIAGRALSLDHGANVEVPYNTALNPASLTISAWVKLLEVRNNRFIGLQSWLGYKFEVQDGNRPFATMGHSGGSYDRDAAVAISQNQWYHLVITFKAGAMVFYINGIQVKAWSDTPNAAASISGTPYNLVFGCDFPTNKYSADASGANFDVVGHADYHVIPAAWGGYFHGYLDEIRIYNTVLTEAQVRSIYNLEKP